MIELEKIFNAKKRVTLKNNIEWSLTFSDWINIWNDSGKLKLRGRLKKQYSLIRLDKEIGFNLSNIKIILNSKKSNSVVNAHSKGTVYTPKGTFNSGKEASKVHGITSGSIEVRIKSSNFTDYYRILNDGTKQPFEQKSTFKGKCLSLRFQKVKTPKGIFETVRLAAEHYELCPSTISRRVNSDKFADFSFL